MSTPNTNNPILPASLPNNTPGIIYGYNNDSKNPEETETILGRSGPGETKRFKGVWRMKSGKWAARTRDPLSNVRVFLGTYSSAEQARSAYFSKKQQFEILIRAANDDPAFASSVIIDNHGYILGEFSSLDDDLRICD